MNRYLLTIITGTASAAAIDLGAFRRAKKRDANAKFDWGIAVPCWFLGGLIGLGAGAGFTE
jgi:hypothetical protein